MINEFRVEFPKGVESQLVNNQQIGRIEASCPLLLSLLILCWFAQLYTNIGVIIRADKLDWDDINDALINC